MENGEKIICSERVKMNFNTVLKSKLRFFKWSLSLGCLTKAFCVFHISHMCATCLTLLSLLDFIITITFGENVVLPVPKIVRKE
jgi:hypothetical protein